MQVAVVRRVGIARYIPSDNFIVTPVGSSSHAAVPGSLVWQHGVASCRIGSLSRAGESHAVSSVLCAAWAAHINRMGTGHHPISHIVSRC